MSGTKISSSNLVNTSSLLLSSFTGKNDKNQSKPSLTSSILGVTESDPSIAFDFSKISKTTSIMSRQKEYTSKFSINVLNAGHTLEVAREGLTQGQNIITSLTDLLKQAQEPTLSTAERETITEKIKTLSANYEKILSEATFENKQLLTENKTLSVTTSQTGTSQKIPLPDLRFSTLGILSLDASSPEAAKKSAAALAKASQSVEKSSAKLQKAHALIGDTADKLQKALRSILKFEEDNAATSTAKSVESDQLSQAQNSVNAIQAAQLLLL